MDFHCIEGLLALPEFRVIRQVMNPKQLEFHLNVATRLSCVPGVRGAAPACKTAGLGVFATYLFWNVPWCCGSI